jgi:intracellular septation protein
MHTLLEFSPLLAFVVAYYLGDIYLATQVLMGAMLLLPAADWLLTRRVPRMHLISAALVWIFGSATLVLRNAAFIQWKPTVFLWLVALAFLGSAFIGREPLAQRLMQGALEGRELPRRRWLQLNAAWVVFNALAGLANILVARQASEATWVNFKVFGLTAATLLFAVGQVLWLSRLLPATENVSPSTPDRTSNP